MAYRVEIDKDICISAGKCVDLQPTAFRFDVDELAEPTPAADQLDEEAARAVNRACPSGAITLYDADGQVVDPY